MDALTPPQACQCPTCGAELRDQFTWDIDRGAFIGGGVAVRFNRLQARVIDALWRSRLQGGVRSVEQFMAMVYGGDADGGPLHANVISVHLHHIRKKLLPTGYTISLNMGQPRTGYRFVKIN